MDLSFPGFDKDQEVTRLPGDLAALMSGVAARQTASVTARAQGSLDQPATAARLLAPSDGAFNAAMAAALTAWKDE